MIRTILFTTALLAAAGVAQAGEIKVSIIGKSDSTIRSDLNQAARLACMGSSVTDYAPCVREAYQDALDQLSKAKTVR